MTKEITKSGILQQMQDKLGLREFDIARFLFDETVTPIYNIEQHLESWWHRYMTKSVTGTGLLPIFLVPGDERWVLRRYDIVFMTGAYTLAGALVKRQNRDPTDAIAYLDLKAAQSTSYHVETDVTLTRGDSLQVNVDGYTSTGDLRVYIDFKKEKIR